MSDDLVRRLRRHRASASLEIEAAARIESLEADNAALVKGCAVRIPTETMEQEFASHYRRGQASRDAEVERLRKDVAAKDECVAVLAHVQWSGYDELGVGPESQNLCIDCSNHKSKGHQFNCPIGKALAAALGSQPEGSQVAAGADVQHVCGLQGFGALGDVCPACALPPKEGG